MMSKVNWKYVFLFLMIAVLGLTGCVKAEADTEYAPDGKEKLKVVSTIFPSCDFVNQIGGGYVSVRQLLKPGMEAHSYEPSPADIIEIGECDLFLYAGGESDVWVEEMLAGTDSVIAAYSLLEWVDPLEEESVEGMQTTGHRHDHEHGEECEEAVHLHAEEYDEHVWTSPQNAIFLVENIRDVLCSLDPERSEIYQQNAEGYMLKLKELNQEYQNMIDSAERNVLVFGDRFPFLYLARNYGLEYYAAFPGCSAQTEPNAATIAFLTDKVRDEEIPVIFQLELSNGKIADCIAEVTNAETMVLHSCHTLTRDEQERGETYISLMRKNLEALRKALN